MLTPFTLRSDVTGRAPAHTSDLVTRRSVHTMARFGTVGAIPTERTWLAAC